MLQTRIPSAEEQLSVLERGVVDLYPRDDLLARLARSHERQEPLLIKAGFDPTAPDLHLGHMVLIEKMAQFQRLGHQVVFLVGDYTALIGDPTGRNAMRPPLSEDQIQKNAATYTDQVFRGLDPKLTRVEWNSRWLGKLSFNDVILLASKYNVGRMLERRDFKTRFEEGKQIALHEFLYPLMQGYDSVALRCDVELGGHDQIFNLNVGRHLMEAYGQKPQIVLTVGLLVGLDGTEKMSKSKGNHIGVTEVPEEMFGKTMSISDEMMRDWYRLLSDRPPPSETDGTIDPLRDKKALAFRFVERFHGRDRAEDTLSWWDAGRPPREGIDCVEIPGGTLYSIVTRAGLATSNADARRKITQGGVSLDGLRKEEPTELIPPGTYLLRVGKKSMMRLIITGAA